MNSKFVVGSGEQFKKEEGATIQNIEQMQNRAYPKQRTIEWRVLGKKKEQQEIQNIEQEQIREQQRMARKIFQKNDMSRHDLTQSATLFCTFE